MGKNPADEHGSDISAYPEVEKDGAGRRIGEGGPPLTTGLFKTANDIVDAVQGEATGGETAKALATDIGMLAAGAVLTIKDPFYMLADFGLTMVFELVEPLNELVEEVTGDPDEMDRLERVWEQVQQATEALSEEVAEAVDSKIPTWSGQAAQAAKGFMAALQKSIWGMAQEAYQVREVLQGAKAVAEALFAIIKSILAELVAWLIMRGLIALANSTWSFGASIAEFMLSGAIKAQQAVTRAIEKIQKAVGIFGKLVGLLAKFMNGKGKPLIKAVLTRAGVTAGLQGGKAAAKALLAHPKSAHIPPGLGEGGPGCFDVDVSELEALGVEMDRISTNAGKIEAVAREAAAGNDLTWGAPGLFLKGSYDQACQEFLDLLTACAPACQGAGERVKSAGKVYSEIDGGFASELNGLAPKIGDVQPKATVT